MGKSVVRENQLARLFRMYKPGQGKQIRLWTAVCSGVLILGAADWAYEKWRVRLGEELLWLAVAATLAVCAVLALVVWLLVGVKTGPVDFLIATESEVKKVTWSTWPEVLGGTKVVIGMVILVAIGLFTVDALFMQFFTRIGVLKVFGG